MADVLAVQDEYRMEKRTTVIQACNASGLSNQAICAQHGILEKTYYDWPKKINPTSSSAPQISPIFV